MSSIDRRRDAYELARGVQTPGYDEWTLLVDRVLFQCCCDCGLSHMLMFRRNGTMDEVKFEREDVLTAAFREQAVEENRFAIPLYKELLALREQNAQLMHTLQQLADIKMTPTKGRIVLVRNPMTTRVVPAIVSEVHSDTCVSCANNLR